MARLFLAVALFATLAGCAAASRAHHTAGRPIILTSGQVNTLRALGAGDTALGLDLVAADCRAQPGGNVVLSPVSVASGLGLAYLGARGATAAVMAKVMHLPAATSGFLEAGLRARFDLLASLGRPGVVFRQSNRIWADRSLPLKPAYIAALRAAGAGSPARVPLLSNPDLARRDINAAIAADTRGHISGLLPPGSLRGPAGWMLTNAMYLNASWATPFDHALTAPGPFRATSGHVTASYLNGDGYASASYRSWAAAELPYQGSRLRMLALLPPVGAPSGNAGGCPLPSAAEVTALAARLAASHPTSGIALPKVKLAWSGSLSSPLATLGMKRAFTSAADFSGISAKACCIGLVQHAATLAVAERGTIASAATAVSIGMGAAAPPRYVLRFDRPYLLVIEDTLTGEPLILAWVANPAG
jgi:serpin B